MTKILLTGIAAVVVAVAIWGGYNYPQAITQVGTTAGNASTAKLEEWSFNPTTASATTSSSRVNSDSQDRVVTNVFLYCSGVGSSKTAYTGAGLAALKFQISTSSTANPAALTNTNYIFSDVISTSSVETRNASTTASLPTTSDYLRWPAGSYLTIQSNATNTAACIPTVYYVQGLGV